MRRVSWQEISLGLIILVPIGIFVYFIGWLVISTMHGQLDYVLEHTAPYPAIKKHFPQEYERMRADLLAAKHSADFKAEDAPQLLAGHLSDLFDKALVRTSDGAMLSVADARLHGFLEAEKFDAGVCYTLISGRPAANPDAQARFNQQISPETKAMMKAAMIKVFDDAGTYTDAPAPDALKAREAGILQALDSAIGKKYHLSVGDFFDDARKKPDSVRCKTGIAMMREAQQLAPGDAALFFRDFLAN